MGLTSRMGRRIAYERARQQLRLDLERIVATAPRGYAGGARVGIATLSSGPWHLAIEILLAHALRLRGAQPELLLCDMPSLPICDERTIMSRSIDRCDGCVDDKRALLDAGAVPWHGLGRFAGAGALDRARAAVEDLDDDAVTSFVRDGVPLGRWLHVSACHYLRRDERGTEAEQIETRRRLLVSAIVTHDAVARWLDTQRPAVVIAESGAHFMWRIVLELARARGIPVVCREMGKGGWDHHIYALNADSMSPNLSDDWAMARGQELTSAEDLAVDEFLDTLPERTYLADAYPGAVAPPEVPRRTAVAFTNVTWDLATAGRDAAFDGLLDWLRTTIKTIAGYPDAHLIVRAHPAEMLPSTRERIVDQLRREGLDGLRNVIVLNGEDRTPAADLTARAGVTLVYTSTAGLEAAARGATVVVAGAPHYRGRGFTIDAQSREDYQDLLSRWASGAPIAPPADAVALARRYFHLFFFRYTIRMGWTTTPLEPPFALSVRSVDELRPGHNRNLDVVCDGILTGRQMVLPRADEQVTCAR